MDRERFTESAAKTLIATRSELDRIEKDHEERVRLEALRAEFKFLKDTREDKIRLIAQYGEAKTIQGDEDSDPINVAIPLGPTSVISPTGRRLSGNGYATIYNHYEFDTSTSHEHERQLRGVIVRYWLHTDFGKYGYELDNTPVDLVADQVGDSSNPKWVRAIQLRDDEEMFSVANVKDPSRLRPTSTVINIDETPHDLGQLSIVNTWMIAEIQTLSNTIDLLNNGLSPQVPQD